MPSVLSYAKLIAHIFGALFRSKREQVILELALRQQLAVYHRTRPRPRLEPIDRVFWVAMRRCSSRWADTLVIVKPETVFRWHRTGFRLYWRRISRPGPGRPRIPAEVRALIRRMAEENRWGARRIHAELEKLDITLGLATVSRYLPKRPPDPQQRQRWRTFLRNHQEAIGAMDFLVVPTVRFELLYVWFLIEHGSRRIVHFDVTRHPTSAWVIQQLRESFPEDSAPRYVIRCGDHRSRHGAGPHGLPLSVAERVRGAMGRDVSSRATRPCRRTRRAAPEARALHLRGLLQRGPRSHTPPRRSLRATRGTTALLDCTGGRPAACWRSPASLHVGGGRVTEARMDSENTHAMLDWGEISIPSVHTPSGPSLVFPWPPRD